MSRPVGEKGKSIIKAFEGCRLTAYKPVITERYYTIGYGHYGADVKRGMVISMEKAESLLKSDCQRFADAVDALGRNFNDNQRDALISFAFNLGAGNLRTLCKDRTNAQIASSIIQYNRSGRKILPGLTARRKAEQALFNEPIACSTVKSGDASYYDPVFDAGYYSSKYPDLSAAGIRSESQLLGHFISNGMKEKRQACATFNVDSYMNNYPDLVSAFGSDYPSYYKHYIEHGMSEKREAVKRIR